MALKVTKEIREDHQALLTLELEPADLERAKRRVARELSKRFKIPGFRPGKAPYEVVALHLGEQNILEEAVEALLDEFYPKALEEAQIEPYGPGRLQEEDLEGNPTFKILVPLKPEVVLDDYRTLRIPYEPPEVTDDEVEAYLQRLREEHAVIEPVERPAQEGDLVYIKIQGEGQRPAEGEDEPHPIDFPEREAPILILEAPQEDEWPFPGFSRELIGLSQGESKTITHTYPEDYEEELLRGATVTYTVTVESVKSRTLPDLDDTFAQTVAEVETLDELREVVREELEKSKRQEYDKEYLGQVMDALLERATLKYPPQAVEETLENMIAQYKGDAARMGLSWEKYLELSRTTEEELREALREAADKATRWELALYEIARLEDIEADADQIQQEVQSRLFRLGMNLEPKQFRRMLRDQDYLSQVFISSAQDVLLRKAEAFLLRMAKGELDAAEEAAEPEEAPAPSEVTEPSETEETPSDAEVDETSQSETA